MQLIPFFTNLESFEIATNVFLTKVKIMQSIIDHGQTTKGDINSLTYYMNRHFLFTNAFSLEIYNMKLFYILKPSVEVESDILKAIAIQAKANFALREAEDALGELKLFDQKPEAAERPMIR